jgi:hypothetical protein
VPVDPPRFITRWDLDKTYLRTTFDTLSDLVASALEGVEEKRTVPGATALLRELGLAGGRVHVLSGSPRQMRAKLGEKLRLDGVTWDELTLKPNLSNLLHLRLGALRDQLGYKLPELLEAHARDQTRFGQTTPLGLFRGGSLTREVLVGDDSESDAFVYSLYADLCSGDLAPRELDRVLAAGETRDPIAERCRRALGEFKRTALIDCILIHLDAQTPPSLFSRYGSRVVPFYNYLQATFVLLERGFLEARGALRITREFCERHGFSADTSARSYLDLVRRGHANGAAPRLLAGELEGMHAELPAEIARELREAVREMRLPEGANPARVVAAKVDYVELAALHRGGKNRRRVGQRFR